MTDTTYAPGSAVGIVVPGVAILLDLPSGHSLVATLFDRLRATSTMEAVIEVLVADGMRGLTSFAAGAITPDGARVVVRGSYCAAIAGAGEPVLGSGAWTDRSVPGGGTIVLTVDGVAASELPIGSGVVLASAIVLGGVARSRPEAPVLDQGIFRAESAAAPPPVDVPEASLWGRPVPSAVAAEPASHPDAEPPPPERGVGVVRVNAIRCPAGHLGPVGSDACRVCHRPVPQQIPIEVPRPPLGVLRGSSGEDLELDGTLILGRHPRVPAGMDAQQLSLITLHDPAKDVSGQHLAVTLDGWRVLVTDLGSTNGTSVVLPGRHPVRLRPREPFPIEPGTRVQLAGALDFTFEIE